MEFSYNEYATLSGRRLSETAMPKKLTVFILVFLLASCSTPVGNNIVDVDAGSLTPVTHSPSDPQTIIAIPTQYPEGALPTRVIIKNQTRTPVVESPTAAGFNIQTDAMLAYVKDLKIFVADYSGRSIPIFNLFQEDQVVLSRTNMKISPDWQYLAYINVKPDLSWTINVIDMQQGRKIFRDIFPHAALSDFAWSPDSKKIALAYAYQNGPDDYAGFISILDPFSGEGRKTLFEPENMIVTQMEWPTPTKILYSYFSFEKNAYHLASLASYNLTEKRLVKRNFTAMVHPAFWFAVSPEKDRVYFYSNPGLDNANGPAIRSILNIPSLQDAPCPPAVCQSTALTNVNWFERYMIGIPHTTAVPADQDAVLYDFKSDQSYSLCLGRPASWSLILHVVNRNDRTIAIFWTSGLGRQPNSLWAWDIGEFLKINEGEEWGATNPECPKPIWAISDAWPDSASIQY
jgi:hypothetical protein